MNDTQKSNEAIEAKFKQTNVAVFQAVLTSTNTPLDIDWQKVREKLDVARPDNAQFKDALRKLTLAYTKVGGPVVLAEVTKQVFPKKRAATQSRGIAPKKPKTEENEEEAEAKDEGNEKEKTEELNWADGFEPFDSWTALRNEQPRTWCLEFDERVKHKCSLATSE